MLLRRYYGHAVDEVDDEGSDAVERPAGNASKADWVAYAVSQGVSEDEAQALKRDELVERFPDEVDDEGSDAVVTTSEDVTPSE